MLNDLTFARIKNNEGVNILKFSFFEVKGYTCNIILKFLLIQFKVIKYKKCKPLNTKSVQYTAVSFYMCVSLYYSKKYNKFICKFMGKRWAYI